MTAYGILGKALYANRLAGKRLVSALGKVLPPQLHARLRALAEQVAFRVIPQYQGETLPPIFHYWSSRCVAPLLERHGYRSPEHFYAVEIAKQAMGAGRRIDVLSLGSGACALEIALAEDLAGQGVAVRFRCIDMNAELLRIAAEAACERGVSDVMSFEVADCNTYRSVQQFDVVLVNQFFHHVTELERLCRNIRRSLAEDGVLLTSDIVGRNGHMLWPAVDDVVRAHWSKLPESRRFDRYHDKVMDRYLSMNHAAYSNEGVRAQDIVPCLRDAFDFEVFLTWGGAIMPFVERRVGFNFDPTDAVDREFIDIVGSQDGVAIAEGVYPASNMLAMLRHKGCTKEVRFDPVSPQAHQDATGRQIHRLA